MPAPLTAAGSARISLRFLSPHRFAALVEAFGTAAQEKGALWVRAYLLRIWCTNLAITQEEMRQVHLGKLLDESMIYSERTYELDAQATVSALKDVIQRQLNAEQLQQHMELIRRANDHPVDASQARDMLRKALQKHEADSVVEAYNSADTANMPAGNSMWRLSNAISWVGGKNEDAERKLEISKLAGQVLNPA